eukprot:jgi/Chrpa1/6404/Chrysochromulina_OHIO_Genome00016774-RA
MIPRAVCQEYKVVAPLTKTKAARHGPRIGDARRGTEARSPTSSATSIVYAFGNTEERYRIKILGCKGKGTLGVDRPFNPHYQSWLVGWEPDPDCPGDCDYPADSDDPDDNDLEDHW